MWPLNLFFLFATAAPQAKPLDVSQDFRHLQLPVIQRRQPDDWTIRLLDESRRNICYTVRSYFFRRQDGHAPVPAGMSTCTPARVSRQRQVSPGPQIKLVPLSIPANHDQ